MHLESLLKYVQITAFTLHTNWYYAQSQGGLCKLIRKINTIDHNVSFPFKWKTLYNSLMSTICSNLPCFFFKIKVSNWVNDPFLL